MSAQEQANVKLTLNGEEAQRELDQVNERIRKLIDLKKKAEAEGDVKGWKKISTELSKAEREAKKLEKQFYDIEKTLKNINGSSIEDLQKAERALVEQTRKLNRETDAFIQKREQLKMVRQEMAKINGSYNEQKGLISKTADFVNRYWSILSGVALTFVGLKSTMDDATKASGDFEERVDNLSALTGLAGDNLEWLEQKAKDLSTATIEGGIKIKQGSQEIIDAFTKVGSARPELLKNKDALVDVTKESIILANAAKTELQPAVEGLTMMLNQFNAPASDSRRIINAMAAGSKDGAGEIPYLTQAIEKSGTVAADAHLNYETLIATIETLAPRITQPEIAGRSLKGVLLDLQNGADDTNPAIVGLTTALENMAKKNLSVTELTKKFGVENITTAKILIDNVAELKRYEKAVTGTNTAIEQATINTDNRNAKLAQAKNRLENVRIELGEKLAPIMTLTTSSSTLFLKILGALVSILYNYGAVMVVAGSSILGYTVAIKIATMWETRNNAEKGIGLALTKLKVFWHGVERGALLLSAAAQALLTGNITRATAAMRLFNIETKLNPIGLIVGIIAAAVVALAMYTRGLTAAQQAQKAVNDVNIEAQKNIVEEKLKVEQLLKVAKNEKLSKETRLKAIKDLNEISPQFLGNLTLENIRTAEARKATDSYTESLLKNAKAQAAKEKLIEIEKELIDLQNGKGADPTFWQDAWNIVKSGGNSAAYAANQTVTALNNIDEKTKSLLESRKRLTAQLDNENSTTTSLSPGGSGKDITQAQDLIKLKETQLQAINDEIAATPAEIESRNKRAEALQNEINKLKELGTTKAGKSNNDQKKKDAQAAIELLDAAHNDIMDKLIIQYDEEGWTDARFKTQQLIAEQAYLEEKKKLLEKYGQSTVQVDAQISQKRIDLQKEFSAYIAESTKQDQEKQDEAQKNEDEQVQALIERTNTDLDIIKKNKDDEKKVLEERARNYQMISETIVGSLSDMLNGSLDEYATYGDALVLMALQILKQMAPIWAAQIVGGSLATPDSIMTGGIAGVVKFTAMLAIMEGFIAIAEGAVNKKINKKREAAKSSGSQYATGKYPVMGADDGKTYDANFAGKPKTGIYSGPQLGLFNEDPSQPELVVDGRTTRQLMINYPAVYRGIRQLASGGAPQFAEGKYPNPVQPYTPASGDAITASDIRLLRSAIEMFTRKKLIIYTEKVKKDIDELEYIEKNRGL